MTRPIDFIRSTGASALFFVCLVAVSAAAQDRPLDVDGNGEVDAFTDLIYTARYLADLPPVPPTYRALDPNIPPDKEIALRIDVLVGPREATPAPTPSPTSTPTRTPTSTPTRTPTSTDTATRTSTVTRTATMTPTATPTPTRSSTSTPSRTSTVTPTGTATVTRTPSRTESPTRTVTSAPTATPQLQGDDTVVAASELAVQNAGLPKRLDWGCAAARCARSTAQETFGFAAGERQALVKRAAIAGRGAVENCPVGGTRKVVCADAIERTLYDDCRERSASGNHVTRNGTVEVSIVGRDICSGVTASRGEAVRIDLVGYRQEERNRSDELLALLEADLRDEFRESETGCAGPEGTQRVDGSFAYQCRPGTESMPCQGEGEDLTMTMRDLRVVRSAGGVPCELGLTVAGEVDFDNRYAGEEARFSQRFEGLLVAEAVFDDGSRRVRQDGGVRLDCLGPLLFQTRILGDNRAGAMVFASGEACPAAGVLEVRRPPLVASGNFVNGERVSEKEFVRRGGLATPTDIQQQLFRSESGKVYQLIRNFGSGADFGAEAVQITTLIGSEAGSVGQCANAAGATSDPQAVAAAEAGEAFPPSAVFKSEILRSPSEEPDSVSFLGDICFSKGAPDGDGVLCIGPDCEGLNCVCRPGNDCRTFRRREGTVLSEESAGIPAATLIEPLPALDDPCSGFAGRATYRFGADGPTTSTRQCTAAPRDGLRLARGEAVVFVYDTVPTALFNAGFGGFPVDVDGVNTLSGCRRGGETVLHFGRAAFDSVAAPVITYKDGEVAFNFDGSRGLCIGGAADDKPCQSDAECPGGFCGGVCQGGVASGESCAGGLDCPGGSCLQNIVERGDCRQQVLQACR